MVKLEDVVRAVSQWAPDVLVSEESDGNIILSLNMKLDEQGHNLMPFELEDGDDIE